VEQKIRINLYVFQQFQRKELWKASQKNVNKF